MLKGTVFNIQRYSLHDGPGIRTTVFLKGCPLRCWWCHNPEGMSPEPELSFIEARCVRCGQCQTICPRTAGGHVQTPVENCILCGACAEVCPTQARRIIGRDMTVEEVLAEAIKDRVFYEDSGGGVTFSGGEPLMQGEFLGVLLQGCKSAGLHAAIDTCGYAPQEELLDLAALADLVLYDLKVMDDGQHRRLTGVSNAAILDNLRALGRVHRNIWIRVPVIPGVNDGPENMEAIAREAAALPGVRQINLLPYHKTGSHKSAAVPLVLASASAPLDAARIAEPSDESMERMAAAIRVSGLSVKIGG
jgi:pyruvate formate lyase activating enzyme